MGRGRIELKKIENVSNRLLTYSKRRNGLFKKAKELSVLCEAEVGILVFSNNGKFDEFASHGMPKILSKYKRYKGETDKPSIEPPPPPMTASTGDYLLQGEIDRMSNESAGLQKTVMMMLGKELDGLSHEDLQNLHGQVREGLHSIDAQKYAKPFPSIPCSRYSIDIFDVPLATNFSHVIDQCSTQEVIIMQKLRQSTLQAQILQSETAALRKQAQKIEGMPKLEYHPLEPEANRWTTEILPLQLI